MPEIAAPRQEEDRSLLPREEARGNRGRSLRAAALTYIPDMPTLLRDRDEFAIYAAVLGTGSHLPGTGQRVVSDSSQDVDGLSRTWTDVRGRLRGPGSLQHLQP